MEVIISWIMTVPKGTNLLIAYRLSELHNSEWDTLYYADLVSQITLYQHCGENYVSQALELAKKLEITLETLLYKTRLDSYRNSLSLLYNALADIYSKEESYHNEQLATLYRNKCLILRKSKTEADDSISNKQSYINSCIKKINNAVIPDAKDFSNLQSLLINAFDMARALYDEFSSEENCHRLNRVLLSAKELIKKASGLTPQIMTAVDVEIEVAIITNELTRNDISEENVRHSVFRLNSCSERLQKIEEKHHVLNFPQNIIHILDCLNIDTASLTSNILYRAYEISGLTVKVSELLIENFSASTINMDGLAVSFAKYGPLCVKFDKKEFRRINQAWNIWAKKLYNETGDSKYQMMILSSQMGLMISDHQENPEEHEEELGKFLDDIFGFFGV